MTSRSKRTWLRTRRWRVLAFVVAVLVWGGPHPRACGPAFPNWLLDGTDSQILSAPIASFAVELRKMEVPIPPYVAQPSERGEHVTDTLAAELRDLRQALSQRGVATGEIDRILKEHTARRDTLRSYVRAYNDWEFRFRWDTNNAPPPPPVPELKVVAGLPREFAAYFAGALAWHLGDADDARKAWAQLLEMPKAERQFKSTWAAYMLGRSWEDARPRRAESYYQRVRALADEGLADTAGLAVASIGREAMMRYRAADTKAAIKLYLQQAAAGDPTAMSSLRLTASDALWKHPRSLKSVARDPVCRRVLTAHLISCVADHAPPVHIDSPIRETVINTLAKIKRFRTSAPQWHQYQGAWKLWLDAVETAKVKNAGEAGMMALVAYQAGEFETARRWLNLAKADTLALWLRAKLHLREGDFEQATSCLATIVEETRKDIQGEASLDASLEGLAFPARSYWNANGEPSNEALGELGAVLLVQREYVEALDALLRSGFWMDAAFVAERVLTVQALKSYVERNWPEPSPADETAHVDYQPGVALQVTRAKTAAQDIRHLLARRLARLGQYAQARPFYPQNLQPRLDKLVAALDRAENPTASKSVRAAALWSAAQILRGDGMELIGTEVGPDWAIYEGSYEVGVGFQTRTNTTVLPPSRDELERVRSHGVTPDRRYHYRYRAADLAWKAAELMPNNDEATANVLYTAGCWLKNKDPKAADLFYKALVNRCRKTPLGNLADKKRWFPKAADIAELEKREENPPSQDPRVEP